MCSLPVKGDSDFRLKHNISCWNSNVSTLEFTYSMQQETETFMSLVWNSSTVCNSKQCTKRLWCVSTPVTIFFSWLECSLLRQCLNQTLSPVLVCWCCRSCCCPCSFLFSPVSVVRTECWKGHPHLLISWLHHHRSHRCKIQYIVAPSNREILTFNGIFSINQITYETKWKQSTL